MWDPVDRLDFIFVLRLNALPRPIDEYDSLSLQALLLHKDDALKEGDRIAAEFKKHVKEEEPIETGDPLIDKWEREFAAGEDPDLDEEL
jgi:hypothetical protein